MLMRVLAGIVAAGVVLAGRKKRKMGGADGSMQLHQA
jgi:molybdopterin-guanine dinucleotide biosynthesis protein A